MKHAAAIHFRRTLSNSAYVKKSVLCFAQHPDCFGIRVVCVVCSHVNMFVFSQGVQLVHGLVLMGPLQVQLDFLHQRNTVSLSDVQLLCFADAILLIWMI